MGTQDIGISVPHLVKEYTRLCPLLEVILSDQPRKRFSSVAGECGDGVGGNNMARHCKSLCGRTAGN
jgi:hypothetical protein